MINKSLKDETNQVMNNLKTILMEVGFDFNNVIKSTFITMWTTSEKLMKLW